MITKVLPVISRIVISYAMKQGEFHGKSIKTETTTWSKFSSGGKAVLEQKLASKEINESIRAGLSH